MCQLPICSSNELTTTFTAIYRSLLLHNASATAAAPGVAAQRAHSLLPELIKICRFSRRAARREKRQIYLRDDPEMLGSVRVSPTSLGHLLGKPVSFLVASLPLLLTLRQSIYMNIHDYIDCRSVEPIRKITLC